MTAVDSYNPDDRWGLGIDENDSDSLNIVAELIYNRKHFSVFQTQPHTELHDIYSELLVPAFAEFLDITGIKDIGLDRIDLKTVYNRFVSVNDLPYGLREKGWEKFLHSTSQT